MVCNSPIDMSKARPKVSVVMATYNGEKFLCEQLDSIINQTYPLYEIIVQDDGSTDKTLDILEEYANRDKRVQLFINEGQHGINNNFYSAIRKASGDFIAISDQDDFWMPDKIEKEVAAITSSNGVLCGGRSVSFSGDGSYNYYDPRTPNHGLLRLINCAEVPGHTMLFRRDWFEQLPSNSPAFHTILYDLVLSISAAASDGLLWIDSPLVKKRTHATSAAYTNVSTSVPSWKNAFKMLLWCLRHYKEVKKLSCSRYQNIILLIRDIGSDTPQCEEAVRMLTLQQSSKLSDMLLLQILSIKHRNEILHTSEKTAKNFLHAFLFPIISCWYNRMMLSGGK